MVKWLVNIATLFLLTVFLFSSTGFIVYKSHCTCSGEEYTSIIIKPATCETEFHQHHKHDQSHNEIACLEDECHECHSCEDHSNSCGCDSPESIFLKLKDKAVDDEVKFVAVQPIELIVLSSELLEELTIKSDELLTKSFYTDPPPKITSSIDFLIRIQNLKIPSLA
ncbi:hypothetical protein SLH46_10745 [Draconibacterium sp. IB214405]|uniref:hypothetical protein n=1 Tax=Draconibacterium sp. IB214405 TaxID=3097352 RepID=UPI002A0B6D9E|nr:hypothetical protein [Draconibacterium sp. IB214405]MDX8339663.1 hypothetical protein [Draconibacterium sp. IB214405]